MDIFTFITNGEDWDQEFVILGPTLKKKKIEKLFCFTLDFYLKTSIASKFRLSMIDTKLDFLAEKKTLHILDKRDFFEALQEYLSL